MTTIHRRSSTSIDQAIAGVARLQHGLITTAQLKRLGLTSGAISKRASRGLLHRVHRGVWAVGHEAMSRDARWLAAVLAVGEGAALSHLAAASLWNIWRRQVPDTDVVSPREHRPIPGITIHQSRGLHPRDMRRRNRIPVTSVARTILDLADVLTPYQLANVIHEAEFRELFRLPDLERLLARYRGRAAVTVVRRALALHAGGSAGTFSGLEDRFVAQAHLRGLLPEVNVQIDVGDGLLRPDFHWPTIRTIVEVDGGGHSRKRTKAEDLGRDARFRAAGWSVIRCTEAGFDAALGQVGRLLREAV